MNAGLFARYAQGGPTFPDRVLAAGAEHALENRVDVLEVVAEVEILGELGYTAEDVARLRREGAI